MGRAHSLSLELAVAVLSEYDADGFIGIAIDAYAEPTKGLPSYEAMHPLGLISRPRDPVVDADGVPTLGATTLRMISGNEEHSLAFGDPRATPKLPRLKKGGVAMYADTGKATIPFLLLDGDTGGAQLYVPYSTTASTIAIDVSTEGAESIQIVHGAGMGFTMTAGGDNDSLLHNKAGDAFVNVNDKGVTINGNTQLIGAVQLGAQSTPLDPPPVAVALEPALMAWITTVLIPALAGNSGAPIIIAPPPSFAATKVTAA